MWWAGSRFHSLLFIPRSQQSSSEDTVDNQNQCWNKIKYILNQEHGFNFSSEKAWGELMVMIVLYNTIIDSCRYLNSSPNIQAFYPLSIINLCHRFPLSKQQQSGGKQSKVAENISFLSQLAAHQRYESVAMLRDWDDAGSGDCQLIRKLILTFILLILLLKQLCQLE